MWLLAVQSDDRAGRVVFRALHVEAELVAVERRRPLEVVDGEHRHDRSIPEAHGVSLVVRSVVRMQRWFPEGPRSTPSRRDRRQWTLTAAWSSLAGRRRRRGRRRAGGTDTRRPRGGAVTGGRGMSATQRVLLRGDVAPEGAAALAGAGLEVVDGGAWSDAEVLARVAEYDALSSGPPEPVSAALLRAGRRLRVIGRAGGRVDGHRRGRGHAARRRRRPRPRQRRHRQGRAGAGAAASPAPGAWREPTPGCAPDRRRRAGPPRPSSCAARRSASTASTAARRRWPRRLRRCAWPSSPAAGRLLRRRSLPGGPGRAATRCTPRPTFSCAAADAPALGDAALRAR